MVLLQLESLFRETIRHQATRDNGEEILVLVSSDNKTVSVVAAVPQMRGILCMAVAGEKWRARENAYFFDADDGTTLAFVVEPDGSWVFMVNGEIRTQGRNWRRVSPDPKFGMAV